VLLFATFHPGLRGGEPDPEPAGVEKNGSRADNGVDQGVDTTVPLPPVDLGVSRHPG
jgi:hypothetical protein